MDDGWHYVQQQVMCENYSILVAVWCHKVIILKADKIFSRPVWLIPRQQDDKIKYVAKLLDTDLEMFHTMQLQ